MPTHIIQPQESNEKKSTPNLDIIDPNDDTYIEVLGIILKNTHLANSLSDDGFRYRDSSKKNGWDVMYYGHSNFYVLSPKKINRTAYAVIVVDGWQDMTRVLFTQEDSFKILSAVRDAEKNKAARYSFHSHSKPQHPKAPVTSAMMPAPF
jgi:hypothetical protein